MSSVATLNQVHFRVRTDTATTDATPTWAAAEDTSISLAVETTFRLRFCVQNTGTAAGTGPAILRVSKNAGAYTAVTTTSGATLGAQSADASTDADGANLATARLTAGAGTSSFPSSYDENGSAPFALSNGFYSEVEYGLILKTAGAAVGNTFDFRLYNNTTAFTTYTQTPRITVRALASGTDFNEKTILATTASDYNAAGHTTSVLTISAGAEGAVGDLAVLAYTADNSSTLTGGGLTGLAGVADSKGNTWTEGYSTNYSPGGALSGANAGIYYSQLTTALVAADTITATWFTATETNRDAVALAVKMFAVAAGKTVTVEATNYNNSTASTPPSLDATTANIECLRVRITGFESNATQLLSSTGWTQLPVVIGNSGTSIASQSLSGEFKISTATSDASTPVAGASADMASVYVAFRADTSGLTACFANDVSSASSVQTGSNLKQVHNPLANDVKSNSSVTQPAAVIRRDILANDVTSASSVSTPAAVHVVPPVACLANDVLSASSVTQPAAKQLQGLLANDVLSASSVTQPAVKQLQGLLANDVLSTSSVTNPAVKSLHGLLANDVASASSVSQPTAGQIVGATALLANDIISTSSVSQPAAVIGRALLANDVASASSVSQPGAFIRRDVLANDVKSNSSVTQPAAVIGRTLLANDVLSASSVSQPAAGIQRAILANDVISASMVGNPIVGIVGVIQGRDVISASSVSQPAVKSLHGLLADDVKSASSVSQPAALIVRNPLANDVLSASSVSKPVVGEITAGQPLANDVVSASFVSTPTLVVEGGEVIPVPPEVGGGGKIYGRGFPRKRWEELLRLLEAERQAALERAQAFPSNKDRQRARKAARAASEAIAAALAAADEAAEVAHAGAITRSLEAAAEAKNIAEYLAQMKAAREEAEMMEDEDEVETLLMVA